MSRCVNVSRCVLCQMEIALSKKCKHELCTKQDYLVFGMQGGKKFGYSVSIHLPEV